jgi:hypothetical protein
MNRGEVENYYKKEVLELTIILLKNYFNTGGESRTFYLKELDQKLTELQNKQGIYKNYPENTCLFIESRIYVEFLVRICELIEDYTGICSALWGNLKDFPKAMLNENSPKKIMEQFTDEKLNILLRYAPLNEIYLSLEEINLIQYIREKNITYIKKYNEKLKYFIKLYWTFFTKYKHGNTLLYQFEKQIINGEKTIIIPAIYNSKNPSITTPAIINKRIYELWKTISDFLFIINKNIIGRAIMYIETGGNLLIEYSCFNKLKQEEEELAIKIFRKRKLDVPIFNINAIAKINVEPEILKKHLDILDK